MTVAADEPGSGSAQRDRGHERYDYWRYRGRDWRWFEPMFARMRPTAPVLDVGSGLGFFVECCLHHETPAIGIELSEQGVASSAARALPIVRADLCLPFPFRDGSFGSAFAHHVLEHVPVERERRILAEIRRVLRPGGFLFAVSPNVFNPDARADPDHINLFSPRTLQRELYAAGFSRVSLATNFWRPFWDPPFHLGKVGILLSGALWKIAPLDRRAGSASALAWK